MRDTTVMIEALDKLTERYIDQLGPDAFAELRKVLCQNTEKATGR
ncbi:MAG: hypothetical protein ABI604_15115 [Nitrospirota bacterium]